MSPDSEGAEALFEAFQQALLERFAQSPEGQERSKADPDMGFWAGQLMQQCRPPSSGRPVAWTRPRGRPNDEHLQVTKIGQRRQIPVQSQRGGDARDCPARLGIDRTAWRS